MEREKLNLFVNILNSKHEITFYLFNVKYYIKYTDQEYLIKQESLDNFKTYPSLFDLFNNYYVYGVCLKELLQNMIIIY